MLPLSPSIRGLYVLLCYLIIIFRRYTNFFFFFQEMLLICVTTTFWRNSLQNVCPGSKELAEIVRKVYGLFSGYRRELTQKSSKKAVFQNSEKPLAHAVPLPEWFFLMFQLDLCHCWQWKIYCVLYAQNFGRFVLRWFFCTTILIFFRISELGYNFWSVIIMMKF